MKFTSEEMKPNVWSSADLCCILDIRYMCIVEGQWTRFWRDDRFRASFYAENAHKSVPNRYILTHALGQYEDRMQPSRVISTHPLDARYSYVVVALSVDTVLWT